MSPEELEAFAIRCAKGNNGGEWLKTPDGTQHYTEAQKEYWRQFVRDLAAAVIPKRIEVVVSETQDECTICNRWFLTHAEAWAYVQATEQDSGCIMKTFSVQRGECQ